MINFLKDKKTYLIAIAAVGYGLYKKFFGGADWESVIFTYILGGAALAAVRAAISKIGL